MTQTSDTHSNWLIVESKFDPQKAQTNETLFALGNGYLGMRGSFEEGLPGYTTEGTYINGFYESEALVYGERLYGYAENRQKMLNLANPKIIQLSIDDQVFSLLDGEILAYERVLDMQHGTLLRKFRWQSPHGKQISVEIERFISHAHPHLAAIRYRVAPLNFSATLKLRSVINLQPQQNQHTEEDPRLGSGFREDVLLTEAQHLNSGSAVLIQKTKTTQLSVSCGIHSVLETQSAYTSRPYDSGGYFGHEYVIEAHSDVPITLTKYIAYFTSPQTPPAQLLEVSQAALQQAQTMGYLALRQQHSAYLADFWEKADILIDGDNTLQKGIRFNMLHLLQSTGKDGKRNVAAKGLTGEGYEGHYFWDSETYILPFFLYTVPQISRKLLEYRYATLPQARARAREMAHPRGALYPWRTINGEECSPYFPAGTAQYHINADIALAIKRYFEATEDLEFMKVCGAEMLFETARLWYDLGDFIAAKDQQFCINGVTGPDEYTCIVDNNAYTNLMARENLRSAIDIAALLKEATPQVYANLAERLDLQDGELENWKKAADLMYVPYDEALGIIPQDDSFLKKAPWDFANTPLNHYPLLLHYHPLVIYRHQVCKQADLLLAEFLLSEQFDLEQKRRDYAYYEPLTTHDSSLSTCIFGIMAAELGDTEKSYQYFVDTATTDLQNKKGNTKDGIHAANMAGTWMAIVFGFAGMRATKKLSFSPLIPAQWQAYAFKVQYQGRSIKIHIDRHNVTLQLLKGAPLALRLYQRDLTLRDAQPQTFPFQASE